MRGARVLVAGGAGFLGSNLCTRLLLDGVEVICLDNFSTGKLANLNGLDELGKLTVFEHDVTVPTSIDGPLDVVLNLASPASPADYLRLPLETLKAGALGTFALLDLAREKNARFVLASTSEAYGDPLVHPQPESYWGNVNPVGPRSVYDEAKRFAEAATMATARMHGVSVGIARIFNTYGPRMRSDDGRAIPNFIRQAMSGDPLTVTGNGSQTRSVCYVTDLVDGLVRLIEEPSVCGPLNIGNPEELQILEIARRVRAAVGSRSEIEFVPRPVDDPSVRRPDVTLADRLLDWQPRVGLDEGLAATVAWFRDQLQTERRA
ncbi:MAG: UDP-glucuronic acid decarboxylase family protein [Pseudonocardiaceae bacterium]